MHSSVFCPRHAKTLLDMVGVNKVFAGFWRRCSATVIDIAMVIAVWLVIGVSIGALFSAIEGTSISIALGQGNAAFFADWHMPLLLGLTTGSLYFGLQESSAKQATLGKRAFGLKVTNNSGRPIGLSRAIFRSLCKILSALPLGLGLMLAGWTLRKKTLHDLLASTLVMATEATTSVTGSLPALPWYGWALNLVVGLLCGLCLSAFLVLLAIAPALNGFSGF
ncbi:MAG TPA: RDD family protein [Rhodanobacteraceae bacterium]|nr:RDD family protein [Rhodanobacteraceae bacterium]